MKTSITKIGNSKGVIIPSHLLKQCGFLNEVSLQVKDQALVISKAKSPREGWTEAFAKGGAEPQGLLLDNLTNEFDKNEWSW